MKKINLVFVLVIAFALFVCASGVASAKTIHVPSEYYPTIQSAIDNETTHNGDTILVAAGTYYYLGYSIDLHKSLTLQGEKGAILESVYISAVDNCVIKGFTIHGESISTQNGCTISNNIMNDSSIGVRDGSIISNNVINNRINRGISARDESKISNNEINGGHVSTKGKSEISNNVIYNGYIYAGEDSTVSNNVIYDYKGDRAAITVCHRSEINNNKILNCSDDGIFSDDDHIKISNNRISNCQYSGIYLQESDNNSIIDNEVSNCNGGIFTKLCSYNTFRGNKLHNNKYNFHIYHSGGSFDIDTSNTVDGKPVYYLTEKSDITIPENAGYVVLNSCNNITVKNLEIKNNRDGITLCETNNSIIMNNKVSDCGAGISILDSNNSTVINNKLAIGYSEIGIRLSGSNNNIVGNSITSVGDEKTVGISCSMGSNNKITNNVISLTESGIQLWGCCYTLTNNNIINNDWGIECFKSGNHIYNNNFIDNTNQTRIGSGYYNYWDDGYPSGGNYWSDHTCTGNPSDGSQPYIINEKNIDHYPFEDPYGWLKDKTLTITDEKTDKSNYTLNETVTISCGIKDKEGDYISAGSVNAKITKPDDSLGGIFLDEEETGRYKGNFTDTDLVGDYDVTIYADKVGYVGDTAELGFGVKSVPVLLIYGLLSEPSTWDTIKERLEDEGYTVDVWDYAPGPETATGNINVYANRLKNHIESNYKDVEKLDIVAHSMGGLITRTYLKNEDGNTKIRKFIMIGTPNNGSELCLMIGRDLHEFFKRIPISFIQNFLNMAETEPAFEQLTPGSDFLLWLNSDFTHLANTEVHAIAGTDDTWNDYEFTFNLPWLGDITIEAGRIYQQHVEPLLVGPDDGVVRVDSVGKTGISPSMYHAAHTWRNPELEHDGIINEVISILGTASQKYSQDRMTEVARSESTNMSIQYAFTDSDTLSVGEEKKYNIPVNFTDDLSFFVGWDAGNLNLTLTTPSGDSINYTTNTANITFFYYYNETTGGIQGFNITNPEEGDWEIDLVAQSSPELNYSLITLVNSSLTLSITSEKSIYEPEEHINLSSLLMNGDTPVIDASVEVAIRKTDGYTESLIMYDDGNHSDGQADDGIYGNVFTNTSLLGRYSITAYASNGDFVRESVNRVIWIEQYPDLTLNASDISFSSETPTVVENITINATIHNIGEADANNASILFYDGEPASGEKIGEDVVNVSVSATANASVSWLAKAGVHQIYVLISPYNEFLEENYTNNQAFKYITVAIANVTFDTGSPANPYPSIFGTHNGTITPNQTITVSKLYTYPCSGTGGHTEYARIWNSTLDVNATWNGYVGDWHNITFDEPFTLFAEKTYYYEVRTGSYPQIIHTDEWEAKGGMGIINCTSFVDANGKIYANGIPAIRLWVG